MISKTSLFKNTTLYEILGKQNGEAYYSRLKITKLKDNLQLFNVKIIKLKPKCPRRIFLMYGVCQKCEGWRSRQGESFGF